MIFENKFLLKALSKSGYVVIIKEYNLEEKKATLKYISPNASIIGMNADMITKGLKLTEDYIYPEDKERFKTFYDITTVRNRIEGTESAYVVDYYKSATPGDNGRMQMYMILPFYYNGRWKYISLCRYADEIKDNSLK